MKRFFKYLSLVAVSIALTTACEKTDENALPNLPLKLSTDEANAKNVTLTLEKGKTFPEATKKEDNKGVAKDKEAITKEVKDKVVIKEEAKVIKMLPLQVSLLFQVVVITVLNHLMKQ